MRAIMRGQKFYGCGYFLCPLLLIRSSIHSLPPLMIPPFCILAVWGWYNEQMRSSSIFERESLKEKIARALRSGMDRQPVFGRNAVGSGEAQK